MQAFALNYLFLRIQAILNVHWMVFLQWHRPSEVSSIKYHIQLWIDVVQLLSYVWLFVTPWTAACQASLSFTISWNLLKLMSIESEMPATNFTFYCPLLLLPSIFPGIRVFFNESALCIRWPKSWSFCFNISPSNEYSGFFFSFRIDWFDLIKTLHISLRLPQWLSDKEATCNARNVGLIPGSGRSPG